jgi:hypothetical protein
VRAHHEVDGARRQRLAQSTRAKRDVADRGIFNEHRDDDFTRVAELADRLRCARASGREARHLCRYGIEHRQMMPGIEDASGHPLAHTTEADETDVHG